jgi:hypothetical protein
MRLCRVLVVSGVVRPPCAELLMVAEAIDEMITQYLMALRSVAVVGQWEAPQHGFALSLPLIRNVEAVTVMARSDDVLVTAAWPNARVTFELSARIIWMLAPDDSYKAECRRLAFLEEYEDTERKIAREVSADVGRHTKVAIEIRDFQERVISALPSGYAAEKSRTSETCSRLSAPRRCIAFIEKAHSMYTAA